MILAKNYETASHFVKVMPRNTVASFFRTRCIYLDKNVESWNCWSIKQNQQTIISIAL